MFCGECGTQNPDTNQFCKNCGKPLRKSQQVQSQQPAPVPAQQSPLPPQAPPPYYPPAEMAPGPLQGTPQGITATEKPPLNKILLVVSIIGILAGIGSFLVYPYLLGILAIVLGGVVIAKPENRRGAVMIIAVIAILIGLGSMIFDLFYLTIMPPVVPDL